MGSDAFNGLTSWYHWQEIPELANIIVIQRAGQEHELPEWADQYRVDDANQLREHISSCVLPVILDGYEISATQIRNRIRSGAEVKGLLPDAVLRYIHDQGIYLDTTVNEQKRGT
jgi:nicotinate-nucleotide adenylyltransferase